MKNMISANEFIGLGSGTISLCGSTKFYFECMEAIRLLTFNNWAVYSCGSYGHSFHKYSENKNTNYELVKKLHFHKILLSQAIVVVSDKSKYIGKSTEAEINFAKHRNIPIFYFDGEYFEGVTEVKPINEFEDDSLIANFEKLGNSLGY